VFTLHVHLALVTTCRRVFTEEHLTAIQPVLATAGADFGADFGAALVEFNEKDALYLLIRFSARPAAVATAWVLPHRSRSFFPLGPHRRAC
jgi:hypothetical protein